MKLFFACNWAKNRDISWSGTHMGLYKALSRYFDVVDVDLSNASKLLRLYGYAERALRKLFHYSDMGIMRRKLEKLAFPGKFPESCIVLQFGEFPDGVKEHGYIYQDLSAGYVEKMYHLAPEVFAVSAYESYSIRTIHRRACIQNRYYQNARAIFTMGHWLKAELTENCGIPADKVYAVGGGCNIDISRIDGSRKTGNKLLFIGRDFKRKNGPLVIEAFLEAVKQRADLELYIAGPKELAADHPGIHVLGDCTYEELVHYYNLCDVFVMPSRFEAYGLVFAEALAFGLPCIGRDAYEMPYFIEDSETGYLLREEDPLALSELMLKLVSNEEIKRNVVSKRQYYLQTYSWDQVAGRIFKIIQEREAANGTDQS